MFGIPAAFLPVIFRAIGAIAAILFVWWAWAHFVANPYIEKGRAAEHENTVAAQTRASAAEDANVRLAADVAALQVKVAEANKALADLVDDATQKAAASRKLIAALKAREHALLAQIADLAAVASGAPAPTPEEACREADRILSELAAHRVRE